MQEIEIQSENSVPKPKKAASIKPEISTPNLLGLKSIPLSFLPSKGKYYLPGFELSIRSATVAEIRHWSTIDENDLLSVDDQLNYILERCAVVTIDGSPVSWKEILEIDRFYVVFRIQELTFPNGENYIPHRFECSCDEREPYSEKKPITSSMLSSFDFPEELEQFYSEELKAYRIESEKLNTSFNLFLPTLGTMQKLREIVLEINRNGKKIDKAFLKIVPYLIGDWDSLNTQTFSVLNEESLTWHINKFTFITKFADAIQQAKKQVLKDDCPKCGAKIDARIFLDSSFTVKDLFLISAGFSELV